MFWMTVCQLVTLYCSSGTSSCDRAVGFLANKHITSCPRQQVKSHSGQGFIWQYSVLSISLFDLLHLSETYKVSSNFLRHFSTSTNQCISFICLRGLYPRQKYLFLECQAPTTTRAPRSETKQDYGNGLLSSIQDVIWERCKVLGPYTNMQEFSLYVCTQASFSKRKSTVLGQ